MRLRAERYAPLRVFEITSKSIAPERSQQKSPTRFHGATCRPPSREAKGARGAGGCPDLRLLAADHSGGTAADSHGLPRSPCLQIFATTVRFRQREVKRAENSRAGVLSGFSTAACASPPAHAILPENPRGGRARSGRCSSIASDRPAATSPSRREWPSWPW